MIEGLKPYSAFKDSGLPWVGKTPTHWDLVPNRGLVKKRKILVGKRHREYQLLSLTKQGVIVRDISTGKGKFSADMGTSQEVRIGDFVFCLFDVPETPRAVGLSRHQGMITGAYTVLEFLGRGNASYFEKFYLAMDDRKLLSPLYSGLRHTIPIARFLGAKTPLPPPDEQAAIVKFLDYANGKIERAIRAKRKLIGLLNEQKQAIIHRAVTRGLDPNVKLKPSGVPWLGDVPEHWVIDRLKHFIQINPSKSEIPIAVNSKHVSFLPMERVSVDGHISKTETIQVGLARNGFTYMRDGDVIVAKITPCFENGKGALCTGLEGGIAFGSTEFHVLRPRRNISGGYLYFLTRDPVLRQLGAESMQGSAGQQRVPKDFFANIQVALPSLSEQKRILEEINATLDKLKLGISSTERGIDLLREYRTTLTAEVVTGKLDVREAAKRLPDNAAETLPPDDSMDEMIEDEVDQEDDA